MPRQMGRGAVVDGCRQVLRKGGEIGHLLSLTPRAAEVAEDAALTKVQDRKTIGLR
jgi:hypothetical protein